MHQRTRFCKTQITPYRLFFQPYRSFVGVSHASSSETPPALQERGVSFVHDSSFYRWESAQGRDLAVLAAAVYKQRQGQLQVLDLMAGSGVRSARYIQQASADLAWSNDANPATHAAAVHNVQSALQQISRQDGSDQGSESQSFLASGSMQLPGIRPREDGLQPTQWTAECTDDGRVVVGRVSHVEASRLLAACFLAEEWFDLIDIDSFGSDSSCLAAALQTVRYGGMLYLTSTDGFSAGGRRPERSLAAYGAYLRALPFANEQGLRMLIGAAAKEAAGKGLIVEPLFSLYSYHGPVFRVMLRVTQGNAWPSEHYGFAGHCYKHDQSYHIGWKQLGSAWCTCSTSSKPHPLALSGPVWTGPLHNPQFVADMAAEAESRGWTGLGVQLPPGQKASKKPNSIKPLEQLLEVMLEESDPRLPPWFVPLGLVGKRAGRCPSRPELIAALQARGFAAGRCHLEDGALRTNASMADILTACWEDLGIQPQQGSAPAAALMI